MCSNLILDLIEDYFRIKEFFLQLKDNSERITFLKSISLEFFNKYKDSGYLLLDNKSIEHFKKNYSVFIQYSDTPFIYPHLFVKYLRIGEKNKVNYLSDLEKYFLFIKKQKIFSLDNFLTTVFFHLQNIRFKFSVLEIELLKSLTNNNFMTKTITHTKQGVKEVFRINSPSYIEIYNNFKDQNIKCSKRNVQRIKTDLFNDHVYYDRRIFINLAKIGFIYVFLEDVKDLKHELLKYSLWNIKNRNVRDYILCLPFGDINNLLKNEKYTTLSLFYFNVNINQFDRKNGWKNFKIPNDLLFSLEKTEDDENTNRWDIKPLQISEHQIDDIDIELLDNLAKSNSSNIVASDRLTSKITKNHIEKRMRKLASLKYFRFHSQINFIGLELSLRFKISVQTDDQHKLNIIKFFCAFPEVMIFSNSNLIIVYIRLPNNFADDLLKNIYLFNILFKEEKKNIYLYSNDVYSIKNTIYVLDSITYKDGVAFFRQEK